MLHYLKRFGTFSIPLSIIFSEVQNLLLLSPYLSLDLVNFQLAFSQFMLFVIFYVFFYSSPVLHWCICQGKPYFFLPFPHIVRTDGSCSWHTYVPRQIFTTYSLYLATKDLVPLGSFTLSGTACFTRTIFVSSLPFSMT